MLFTDSVANIGELHGETYALGCAVSIPTVFYNLDLVRQAGGDPANLPETWDGILALARDVHELSPDILGASFQYDSADWLIQALIFGSFLLAFWGQALRSFVYCRPIPKRSETSRETASAGKTQSSEALDPKTPIREAQSCPPAEAGEDSTRSLLGTGGRGMKGVDTIARVRRKFFVRGKTIKEIERELHVSRNTIRKILRSGATAFAYERAVQPMPKIGPWREALEQLLAANAAWPSRERLTLMRVFEELRGLGYEGGYDAVRRYAASGPLLAPQANPITDTITQIGQEAAFFEVSN